MKIKRDMIGNKTKDDWLKEIVIDVTLEDLKDYLDSERAFDDFHGEVGGNLDDSFYGKEADGVMGVTEVDEEIIEEVLGGLKAALQKEYERRFDLYQEGEYDGD